MSVVVADLDEQRSVEASRELPGSGHSSLRVDVADPASVEAVFDTVETRFGPVSVLACFAGIGWMPGARILVVSSVAAARVASSLSSVAKRGSGAYTASKHGVLGLTRAAALDYADAGIRVNAVGPGYIRTPLIAHLDEAPLIAQHPMGRLGEAEEIAELILFLASPRASFTTGGYFTADGGYLSQ